MNYSEVLVTAWKIIWKYKFLWLIGMLGGLVALLFLPFIIILNPGFAPLISPDLAGITSQPWFLVIFFTLLGLMVLASYFVGSLVMAAIDLGAVCADRGSEGLSFTGLLKDALPYFWRVFGVMALYFVVVMGFFVALMAIFLVLAFTTMGLGMICLMPFLFLITPLTYLAQALVELAVVAIVADNMGVGDAIKQAWALLKKNFWQLVLIVLILYFGVGSVSGMLMTPFMLPFGLLPVFLSAVDNMIVILIGFGIFMLVFILGMAVISGLLGAYMRTAWSLAYLRLTAPVVPVDDKI